MSQSNFRIFDGTENVGSTVSDRHSKSAMPPADKVTVSVGDIFPALADALATSKAWLKDFEDDEIVISYDLYEVILAYQHYQRLSA